MTQKYKNSLSAPKMTKIVLNMGLAGALRDQKLLDEAVAQLTQLGGQKPIVTRAKRAIAGFKLRQGDAVGAMVTLRGKRMQAFFEKFVRIVLPRVRDFHGVSHDSFDGNGNYSLGFTDISIFPEVDTTSAGKNIGIQVTIDTTAKTNEEAKEFLTGLGMPFKKGKVKS